MPTFTAIALDRLIEPGAAKSMVPVRNYPDSKLGRSRSTSDSIEDRRMDDPTLKLERGVSIPPIPKLDRGVRVPHDGKLERGASVPASLVNEKAVSVPPDGKLQRGVSDPSNGKLEKRLIPLHLKLDNGAQTATVVGKKHHWTQISPALYATPESTPLPDSPSSFPPSPYIVNHKRRGPRLMKSFSEDDVAAWKKETDEIKVDENANAAEEDLRSVSKDDIYIPLKALDSAIDEIITPSVSGSCNDKHGNSDMENGLVGQNDVTKSGDFSFHPDNEVDDVVNRQAPVNVKSNGENEDNGGAEQSFNSTTPMAEFYDAWEELSSESGHQQPLPDIESELREIRLSLLMEIEKRKQAEEALIYLRSQWQRICEQLSLAGLNLPADPTILGEGAVDTATELCQQVYLARVVSNSLGRGAAKAEVEMEMEAQIKLKNIEIARLLDRLRYFEAVNQEMSQRNQEAVETARRLRQRRNRRQKWIWGSVATAATLGSAALLYSYLKSGKGSSSPSPILAPEVDHSTNK